METQTQTPQTKPDAETLVPILNAEPRLRRLAWNDPNHTQRTDPASGMPLANPGMITHKVELWPGLNYVRLGDLESAGFDPDNFQGALRYEEPHQLPEFSAVEVAAKTASAPALRRWLEDESRVKVRAAIERRLAEIQKRKS